jgi:hypothetical protein
MNERGVCIRNNTNTLCGTEKNDTIIICKKLLDFA